MKKKIISELYHGNIVPSDRAVIQGSEYEKHQNETDRLITKLENGLNPEQKKLLDEISEGLRTLEAIASKEFFSDGFKLGVRLLSEAYESENEQFKPIWE